MRGPGESQLEIDKRLVRDRIITLKQKIDNVQKQRTMHRRGRERTGLPILSIVGYTNAGKSTLLNYLTRAGVMAESMLFATLDPTTRKVKLPGHKTSPEILLTDTVGFIQKLPTAKSKSPSPSISPHTMLRVSSKSPDCQNALASNIPFTLR